MCSLAVLKPRSSILLAKLVHVQKKVSPRSPRLNSSITLPVCLLAALDGGHTYYTVFHTDWVYDQPLRVIGHFVNTFLIGCVKEDTESRCCV